ncbi:hypothetical protein P9281_02575 [Caballeronia sp. LP003]|uniref:hypothetical protein n=1 Tax=Caballeronia sp. LP003 TaxID=3038551 RepID=UPI002866499D|nr:hypothetical protein [Caballeronia sp. LP003]MDR5785437.1 hypothetical protein [Caballeronia sp. LP003]
MNIRFDPSPMLGLLASAAVIAVSPISAVAGDVSTFDVAGIKLGMTPVEAQARIAQHFGIAAKKVRIYSQEQFVLGGKIRYYCR